MHVREIGVGQTVEATPLGRVEVVRHGDRALAHQREPARPAGGIVVRGESVPAEDGHAEEHEHPEGQDADRGEAPASPPAEVSPRETSRSEATARAGHAHVGQRVPGERQGGTEQQRARSEEGAGRGRIAARARS